MSPASERSPLTVDDPLAIRPLDGFFDATVDLPGSKSITNRALICAALSDGASEIERSLASDDTAAMVVALRDLGLSISDDGGALAIGASRSTRTADRFDARQSGTTARFLLPLLALGADTAVLDGDEQLRARPMGPSIAALRQLGASARAGGPHGLPVTVTGPIRGGSIDLAGDVSSQFLSGLLLAGPRMPDGLRVHLTTPLVSRSYVDMTVAVARSFGARIATPDERTWVVDPGALTGHRYVVEPDASSASYVFAAAAMTGSRVTVPDLSRSSLQGDVRFVEILDEMGAEVTWHDDAITVQGTGTLRGIDVDMEPISDTVPTLVAVAAVADGPTTIRGVGFIRRKESDRIAAPVMELRRLGVGADETDDGLVIRPSPVQPGVVQTYRDHRMAMSFALLGLVADGIEIADPACVDKTFTGYWQLLAQLRSGSLPAARRG